MVLVGQREDARHPSDVSQVPCRAVDSVCKNRESLSLKVRLSVKGRCVATGGRGPLGVALAPWGPWWRRPGRGIPGQLPGYAPVAFSPGSYLCFESSKSGSSKRNKVIKLVDITDIQKVGWAPSSLLLAPPASGGGGRRAVKRLGSSRVSSAGSFAGLAPGHGRAPLLEGLHAEPPGLPSASVCHDGPLPPPHGSAPGALPQMGQASTAGWVPGQAPGPLQPLCICPEMLPLPPAFPQPVSLGCGHVAWAGSTHALGGAAGPTCSPSPGSQRVGRGPARAVGWTRARWCVRGTPLVVGALGPPRLPAGAFCSCGAP